jgi:glycosyltransferase involved in cell wall biosynthesis
MKIFPKELRQSKVDDIHEKDVLFLCPAWIKQSLAEYRNFFINLITDEEMFANDPETDVKKAGWNSGWKSTSKRYQTKAAEVITKYAEEKNFKLIVFLYNSRTITELVKLLQENDSDIRVVAYHQKHYFNKDTVASPVLKNVMEYSLFQAPEPVFHMLNNIRYHHNEKYAHKYLYMPYPDYDRVLKPKLSEEFNEADFSTRYVFISGRNNRDIPALFGVMNRFPDLDFVYATGIEKGGGEVRLGKPDNPRVRGSQCLRDSELSIYFSEERTPPNCKLLGCLDLDTYNYLLEKCWLYFIPITGPVKGLQPRSGHSSVAGAISHGKIIITTKKCGQSEAIKEGLNGFTAEPVHYEKQDHRKRSKPYFEFFRWLLNDEKKYNKMSKYAESIKETRSIPAFIRNLKKHVLKNKNKSQKSC